MGVSKVIINGVTRVDLTQDTVAPEYLITDYTAHNRTGQAIVGTAVTDNDFTITLTKVNDVWTPDCTFAEAYAAYTAGKNIVFTTATDYVGVYGKYESTESAFYYLVTVGFDDFNGEYLYNWGVVYKGYIWTSNGIETADDSTYYTTELATASPSDVTQGKVFYNTEGVQVGTMSSVSAAEEKAVNFIDYDGTILYSYTSAEFAQLSALPANPSHAGLTTQGWNWTLTEIQTQLTAVPNGTVWVGQIYTTTSGSTEIDVEFIDPELLSPFLCMGVNGSVTVDWGDNSSPTVITGSSEATNISTQHVYSQIGDYTIAIHPDTGATTYIFLRANTSPSWPGILRPFDNSVSDRYLNDSTVYSQCIKAIRFGPGAKLYDSALMNHYNLTSVTIPDGFTLAGTNGFRACHALKSVSIPRNWTNLNNDLFEYCRCLTSIALPPTLTTLAYCAFQYCDNLYSITIPYNVTVLGTYCLRDNTRLHEIYIPEGVSDIGESAFSGCVSITHLEIPDSVTSISQYAFSGTNIKSIIIPNTVTSIGENVLSQCKRLEQATLPNNLTSIPNYMFYGCRRLLSIEIPTSVTSIGNYAFTNCLSLTSVDVPGNVTSIGTNAFSSCQALTTVNIPNGVTTINQNTFNGCTSLTSIDIPSGVTDIGASAFRDTNNITEMTIPGSVTSIGAYAFYCTRARIYHFLSSTPPTLANTNVFRSASFVTTIYVPTGSLEAYQTATNWSTYASQMQEE